MCIYLPCDLFMSKYTIFSLLAQYLGSTPILLSGIGAIKSARMHQAQQAVKLIKVHVCLYFVVRTLPSDIGHAPLLGTLLCSLSLDLYFIQDPENDSRPQFDVSIKISTQAVKIVDSKANVRYTYVH